MISMSRVAQVAKFLFPAKAAMIDKAVAVAKQFQPNKDGVTALMQQYGKTKEDWNKAIGMLDNPIVKGAMSRVPGLENAIRSAASEVPASAPAATTPPTPSAPQPSGGASLADRWAKLKRA